MRCAARRFCSSPFLRSHLFEDAVVHGLTPERDSHADCESDACDLVHSRVCVFGCHLDADNDPCCFGNLPII